MTAGPAVPPRDGGAALLTVLWFVVAMAALATTFLKLATGDRLLIVTQSRAVEARALAQDGLARTLIVLNGRADKPLPQLLTWNLPEGVIVARVGAEVGKVDLNAADQTLLAALVKAVGLPAGMADPISQAIVDWRDPDDLRLNRGAERADYEGAKRDYGPANAPFRRVEELRYVLGVDNAVYARLSPYLTVYSGQAQPDQRLAAPPVLVALGATRTGNQQQQNARRGRGGGGSGAGVGSVALGQQAGFSDTADASPPPGGGPTGTPQPGAAGGGGAPQPGRAFNIGLDVRLPGGYESHARAIVALVTDQGTGSGGGAGGGDQNRRLLRVLDWATGLPAPAGP